MTHINPNEFKVTFKGVRGSIPTPMTPDQVEEKILKAVELIDPEDLKDASSRRDFVKQLPNHIKGCFGGNSSCVHVEVGGHHLIFDGGSGLRVLGLDLMSQEFSQGNGKAHIFLSHTHLDHIMGIPFFIPFYVPGNKFTFYGVHKNLRDRLEGPQQPHYFPVPFDAFEAEIDFVQLEKCQQINIGDVTISWKQNYHPGKSYAYRVDFNGKSMVYSTDAEYKEIGSNDLNPEIDFCKDVNLLIFDAQYTFIEGMEYKREWGHSSAIVGIDIALEANVKQIAFYHHEPTYNDFKLVEILGKSEEYLRSVEPESPIKLFFAQEGLTVDLFKDDGPTPIP